jgi:creatinine amidohydrolase
MDIRYLTWTDVQAYLERDDRVILPIGSTEQHSPAGILGTDFLIADALGAATAEQSNILSLPGIPFGMALHHMEFPGTCSLQPKTVIAIIEDILTSLYYHGFRKILIINGHSGNQASILAALPPILNRYLDLRVKVRMWWEYPRVEEYVENHFGIQDGDHATVAEISVTHFLFPEQIKSSDVPYTDTPYTGMVISAKQFRARYPQGNIGSNVSLANATHGKALFQCAVEDSLDEIQEWDPPLK